MFKYALFDLDGTLTDSGEGIINSVKYALHDQGIDETDMNKLRKFVGPPLDVGFSTLYGMDREHALHAIKKYREYYEVTGILENEVYKGIPELLSECRDMGMVLAVASSKPWVFVKRVLNSFDIEKYFDVIVGSELDGRRSGKKEVVEETIRQLQEKCGKDIAAETAMIGDRCYDIEGALEHHLTAVGVTFGYGSEKELQASGAQYVAHSVEELRALLTKN